MQTQRSSSWSRQADLVQHLLGQVRALVLACYVQTLKTHGNLADQLQPLAGDFKAGDILGGAYTVVETLGRGSSGVTYKV